MPTHKFELTQRPDAEDDYEPWLEHAAGFVIFEDARQYATDQIDAALEPKVREAVQKGIDDAIYGMMMIADGVTGALSNETHRVEVALVARYIENEEEAEGRVIRELNLADGNGSCMAFHGWREGDFGSEPVATPLANDENSTG